MTRITWGEVGERKFQTGVDRGVLYAPGVTGVPWNGLTSIEEDSNREVSAFYLDGVKHLEYQSAGDFVGSLSAYTYPDEFDVINGIREYSGEQGMFIHEQPPQRFSLCYRTKIGNDVDGIDLGYKLHILYRLSAVPSTNSFQSMDDKIAPVEFSWDLTGLPVRVPGSRPTCHLSFNSTRLDPAKLDILEDILYGTESSLPRLPTPEDIITIIAADYVILILDNGDGTWSAYGPDDRITMLDFETFQITDANAVYLDADTYEIANAYT
jgi:hypothetical protein